MQRGARVLVGPIEQVWKPTSILVSEGEEFIGNFVHFLANGDSYLKQEREACHPHLVGSNYVPRRARILAKPAGSGAVVPIGGAGSSGAAGGSNGYPNAGVFDRAAAVIGVQAAAAAAAAAGDSTDANVVVAAAATNPAATVLLPTPSTVAVSGLGQSTGRTSGKDNTDAAIIGAVVGTSCQ